jgi:hypothetical protein
MSAFPSKRQYRNAQLLGVIYTDESQSLCEMSEMTQIQSREIT